MASHPHLKLEHVPDLRDPTMILAWGGWNDAGESASLAARYLTATLESEPLGEIDAEEYYDFTEVRPLARYEDGSRRIVWPTTDLYAVRDAALPRDLIIALGVEPNHRWHSYMDALLEVVRTYHVGLAVTLGSVAAAVPHTRPVAVHGSANNAELAAKHSMLPSRFEGPTGIVGVFHDYLRQHGVPGVSLWASVPHYLPRLDNPTGARALLQRLEEVTGLRIDYESLDRETKRFEREVHQALDENRKLARYVTQLEASVDGDAGTAPHEELPPAEGLIDDLERFLRSRRDEEP